MSDNQIEEIVRQLRKLNLRQAELLERLGIANEPQRTPTRTPTVRDFAIGDRVRIKNPRIFQPSVGTISKIGPNRITVTTVTGNTVVRAPKNLELI